MTSTYKDPMSDTAVDQYDRSKRTQIMDGARRVFLDLGFDGASVGDIVKAAGISKGTLYAYFPSKEKLFETLVIEDRQKQAEAVCAFDPTDQDVAKVLSKLGVALVEMLLQPDHVAFLRIVIAASGKFPEMGRAFYEAGPRYGINRLSSYLQAMTGIGILKVDDYDLAARQFMDLCKAGWHTRMMLGYNEQPSKLETAAAVDSAVSMFMKTYA